MRNRLQNQERYWIAINEASCAVCQMPLKNPVVKPIPQQLLGFPTLDEAKQAQETCLTAPISGVKRFLGSLAGRVKSGEIKVIQPTRPEPPTRGATLWIDG